MKFIIAVVTIAFIYGAQALSKGERGEVKKHRETCAAETGVRRSELHKLQMGQFSDDERVRKYVFCVFNKSGLVSDSGEWFVDVIREKIAPEVDKEDLEKSIENCKGLHGKDIPDIVYNRFECYKMHIPKHIYLA